MHRRRAACHTPRHTAVKRVSTLAVWFLVAHVDQDLCFRSAGSGMLGYVSRRTATLGVVALAASLAACGGSDGDSNANAGAIGFTLAVLETTDLHFNVRSYDYFKLGRQDLRLWSAPPSAGGAAKRICQHPAGGQRRHHPGHRAGRLRSHHQPHPRTQQLSMYKAMGALGFDAARWATTSSTTACPS